MPVGEETLRLLFEANMGQEWIMKVVASLSDDSKPRSKNAERQARWREKHKPMSLGVTNNVTDNVTSNVTTVTHENPHKDNYTTTRNYPDKTTLIPPRRAQERAGVSRGTRLPDDFQPLQNILEDARQRGMTDADYWDEFERFKDFWRGVPGRKGEKLDWQATWRNRMKDTADRKAKTHGRIATYSKPLSISERLAGFAAKLDEADGEGGDSGNREDAAGLPRLRQSA